MMCSHLPDINMISQTFRFVKSFFDFFGKFPKTENDRVKSGGKVLKSMDEFGKNCKISVKILKNYCYLQRESAII